MRKSSNSEAFRQRPQPNLTRSCHLPSPRRSQGNFSMDELRTDLERAEYLVNLLVSAATGKDRDERGFKMLRTHFLADATLQALTPDWLRTNRTLDQFWPFIQRRFARYAERRKIIRAGFGPLLDFLEKGATPAAAAIDAVLLDFSEGGVHDTWRRATDRIASDPEGAITLARSLLESVLKHILDERKVAYNDKADLPEFYRLVAKELNLAPDQHTEDNFKRILGGITSVVNELGPYATALGMLTARVRAACGPLRAMPSLPLTLRAVSRSFLLRQRRDSGEVWLVETKGGEDLNDPASGSALAWCEDSGKLDAGRQYRALFVREEDCERYKPKSFHDAVAAFGN